MYNLKLLSNNLKTDFSEIIDEVILSNKEDVKYIEDFLKKQKTDFEGLAEIYPPINLIFNCFDKFNIENTKVIILGQDPYHGPKQAQGLCFSVNKDIKIPPSLKNIYKEIEANFSENESLKDKMLENHKDGDLNYLAEQGVLLLNTSLTVRQSKPLSHAKVWSNFTKQIISKLTERKDNIVILLWGAHAKSYKKYILGNQYILEANHPSPLSANRGGWFGCNHFKKTNIFLKNNNITIIDW